MKKTIMLLALFSLIIGLISCQKAEEITVTKYFQAMQHQDNDTMAAMAVEPKAFQFKAFKIIASDEPEIVELELASFEKQLIQLEEKKKEQLNVALDKNDIVEDLKFELEETRRRAKKAELQKQIEEAESVAKTEKDMFLAMQLDVNKMKKKIEMEKQMITKSCGVEGNFSLYTGETHRSKVTVSVTLVNDEVKEYIFLLRKSILTLENRTLNGRMIVTKIATKEDFENEMNQQEENAATTNEEVTEEEPTEEKTEEQKEGEG